jgi:hypothetical protein
MPQKFEELPLHDALAHIDLDWDARTLCVRQAVFLHA